MKCVKYEKECEYKTNKKEITVIIKFINSLDSNQLKLFKQVAKNYSTYRDIINTKLIKKTRELKLREHNEKN